MSRFPTFSGVTQGAAQITGDARGRLKLSLSTRRDREQLIQALFERKRAEIKAEKAAEDADPSKHGTRGIIGKIGAVGGGIVGGIFGGPVGAAAGARLGAGVGGGFDQAFSPGTNQAGGIANIASSLGDIPMLTRGTMNPFQRTPPAPGPPGFTHAGPGFELAGQYLPGLGTFP